MLACIGVAKETTTVSNTGVKGFDPTRLKAARERAGLTQRDLAEKLITATQVEQEDAGPGALSLEQLRRLSRKIESARTQINYYEAGKRTPRADMLYRVATALGVDPLDLLDPCTPLTLATLRARRGLLQEDVARQLNCSRAYYARMEWGNAEISITVHQRLAELLAVNTGALHKAAQSILMMEDLVM